eukprot:TRINITY_DN16058_c0_g1_i1.p1 TRINITY_DN16058_c0_g1~~TRINITY_DN16058_c0_g1_i1.p1  ORF type:complete len:143 (-),score=41.58 TRINITY_DN16058_c0_g1_i1:171-599(-)
MCIRDSINAEYGEQLVDGMGVHGSTLTPESTVSVEISPGLTNELAKLAIAHHKNVEQQAFISHFQEVDASEAEARNAASQAEVASMVQDIESRCFRPNESPYQCGPEQEACLRCFSSNGDMLLCAEQLRSFKTCSEAHHTGK